MSRQYKGFKNGYFAFWFEPELRLALLRFCIKNNMTPAIGVKLLLCKQLKISTNKQVDKSKLIKILKEVSK